MSSSTIDRSKQPNHDRQVIAISASFAALSTTALGLRLMSKRLKRSQLCLEDYLAMISWVSLCDATLIRDLVRRA